MSAEQGKGGGQKKKVKKKKLSKEERMALRAAQQARPVVNHPDDADFGDLVLNQSKYQTDRQWTELGDVNLALDGKEIWVRARVHTNRSAGKLAFLLLRSRFIKLQAAVSTERADKKLVKYVNKIPNESIVDIFGTVTAVKDPIQTATREQQAVELQIKRIYGVAMTVEKRLPFNIQDASYSEADYEKNPELVRVGRSTRLDHRWIDLRTTANHAIFRIQAGVGKFFRDFLAENGFLEIHSPKLIGAASEGGSNVFKLGYFGKDAFLAQSPQLYKQMGICSDFKRVFEVGPVFRAEESFTHRHLCEFTGLDLESEFKEHYHEVVNLIGDLFVYIFKQLNTHYRKEIEAVREQFPFEDLVFNPNRLLILTFKEAKKMTEDYHKKLIEEKRDEEADRLMIGDSKDFSTPEEKLLGRLVKERYGTEFYCVDKYPLSARPFYTMMDPFDGNLTNSYDFFIRGEEIMSGAQRIHDPVLLTKRAKECEIPVETLRDYIDSFKYGTAPHAGGGVGLERVVMLFLGLDNIRSTSLFPRDPRRCTP